MAANGVKLVLNIGDRVSVGPDLEWSPVAECIADNCAAFGASLQTLHHRRPPGGEEGTFAALLLMPAYVTVADVLNIVVAISEDLSQDCIAYRATLNGTIVSGGFAGPAPLPLASWDDTKFIGA